MVEITTIFSGLEVAAITIGIVFAFLQLRDINKTRQAELFTALRETMDTTEFWMKYKHIVIDNEGFTLKDIREAVEKRPELYGEMMSLVSFYQHIGWLVKTGHMNINSVGENMALAIIRVYEALVPHLHEFGRRVDRPQMYENFDYLYEKMKIKRKERIERMK